MITCSISKNRFAFFSSLTLSILTLAAPLTAAQSSIDDEKEACKKNLNSLFKAIKSYRADKKDLPPYLSDLIPRYVKDPNILICPTVKRTGNVVNFGINDPKLSTAYIFEFCESPVPEQFQGNASHTMKEWKRRQMGLVGSKIPMVRCHHHTPVLNLSFDGKIYDSVGAWESELVDEIDPAELTPARLFASDAALLAKVKASTEIPNRDPKTPATCLDLSKFYNAALTEGWHRTGPNEPIANDLSQLPRGLQRLADIDFDIRGLIQLSSQKLYSPRFAPAVKEIPVDRKAKKLHFLHATGWSAPDGTPVVTAVIHMTSGKTHEFTFNYGDHLIDWVAWQPQPKDSATSIVAWTGRSPATGGQTPLNLFKSQWINPEPEETIASVDYIASNLDPAPFLIAITVE